MLIYTIVLPLPTHEDVMSWAANKVDLDLMTLRSIEDSVLIDQKIVRFETDLTDDDYTRAAFEGSLNALMRDREVVWWNRMERAAA
jgi:hypothetical protein